MQIASMPRPVAVIVGQSSSGRADLQAWKPVLPPGSQCSSTSPPPDQSRIMSMVPRAASSMLVSRSGELGRI